MEHDPTKRNLEQAQKHVADEIEAAIDVPASIEAEAMLEAAEIEELAAGEERPCRPAGLARKLTLLPC